MSHRYWITIVVLVSLLLVLFVYTGTTSIDESILSVVLAEDIPISLLDDETCIEIYRSIGYNITIGFQNRLWSNFFKTIESGDERASRYQLKEIRRLARLDSLVFGTRYYQGLIRMLSSSRENMDNWIKLWRFRWKFFNKLRTGEIRNTSWDERLKMHLSEIERLNLEKWCFMDYEVAADYYFFSQRDSTAFEYLKKAYDATLQTGHYPICSHLAGRIGAYLAREGRFEEAMEYYKSSLEFARAADDPYLIARAISFTSFLKASIGEFAVADSLMRESLEFCNLTRDPICEISKLVGLARLYNSFGETEKALYHIEEAVLIATEKLKLSRVRENKYLYESITHYLATAFSLKGRINLKLGNVEDAVNSIKYAIDIFRNSLDRYSESQMIKLLADAYATSGDYGKAEKLYSRAVRIVTKLKKRRKLSEYLTSIGQLYLETGDTEKCRAVLEKAMKIAGEEEYWMQEIDIAHLLSKLYIAEKDTTGAKYELESAIWTYFHRLEKATSRGDRKAQVEKVDELFMDLFDLLYSGASPCDSMLFWKRMHYEVIRTPVAINGFNATAIGSTTGLKNLVGDDHLLLQYIKGTSNYYLVAISDDGVSHHRLPGNTRRLEELIEKFVTEYERGINPFGGEDDLYMTEIKEAARGLGKMLFGGAYPLLKSKSKVTVIPDGPLVSLPFELILSYIDGTDGSDSGCPFIAYLPSICFVDSREGKHETGTSLESALVVSNPYQAKWVLKRYPALLPLESAGKETSGLNMYIDKAITVKGKAAKKDSVVKLMKESRLLHFATHSIYYPEYEGKPSLLLASDDSDRNMAHITLSPDEIKRMDIKAHLVVLATCESSSEKKRSFKQELGIAEAFLVAGAERVIAVRGTIKDSEAAAFFGKFYKNLFERKLSVEEAFHLTRNEMVARDTRKGDKTALARWSRFILLTGKLKT